MINPHHEIISKPSRSRERVFERHARKILKSTSAQGRLRVIGVGGPGTLPPALLRAASLFNIDITFHAIEFGAANDELSRLPLLNDTNNLILFYGPNTELADQAERVSFFTRLRNRMVKGDHVLMTGFANRDLLGLARFSGFSTRRKLESLNEGRWVTEMWKA